MSVKKPLMQVGFDKNAEFDFGISSEICDLNVEHMNEFRAMVICAIGTMEDMFRREIERRNPASMERQP
jgi:hypothetical protein